MRVLLVVAVAVAAVACSGDDDGDTTASTEAVPTTQAPPTTPAAADTAPPPTVVATTVPATSVSVITDTQALGASTLSSVDLTTGSATQLGGVGTEIGVLGIAVEPGGTVLAITDQPELLALDPAALDAPGATVLVDAAGSTLLALARRADGTLFAVADTGAVVRLDAATGATTIVAEIALDDPGVGLDVAADGRLEVVVATGAHVAIDVETGEVADLPPLTAGGAATRVVALAHDATGRYGVDADADQLVAIADDGAVTPIGPLGLDATDGASLDIGADGTALLANPG